MYQGKIINTTEKREVLHFLMRSSTMIENLSPNAQ